MTAPTTPSDTVDAVVVGAGFGGLAAALRLAEDGLSVRLHERLKYPGGCASTFERQGYRFEAGATLFSGLSEDRLFGRWIARYGLDVPIDWIDPIVEFRSPGRRLVVERRRGALLEALCAEPDAPAEALAAFFAEQRRVADVLWDVLDEPELLPPWNAAALLEHAKRLPRYTALVPHVGRSLLRVLARYGLDTYAPLVSYLDGLCQITVQCSAAEAEAPFALGTMDYYHRGTGHVRGGIGTLAWGLVGALGAAGGEARMADGVTVLRRDGDDWLVTSRSGTVRARYVVANMLPHDVDALLERSGESPGRLRRALSRLSTRVDDGWGAAMLYLAARPPASADGQAHHVELVQDTGAPFVEGNHLFCSISGEADTGRAPDGQRTITVSTHVPMAKLASMADDEVGPYVAAVQQRMRDGLAALAPDWWGGVEHELTASPRTYQRFTGRHRGLVGGIPRRAGLLPYLRLLDAPRARGLHVVGDSVFPGQSTLAAALGGVRTAARISGVRGARAASTTAP